MGFIPDPSPVSKGGGRFIPDEELSPEPVKKVEKPVLEERGEQIKGALAEGSRAVAGGLIKGGASGLDLIQKTSDIISLPLRTKQLEITGKDALTRKFKTEFYPNAFQAAGNQADRARQFADEYLKTETLAGKIIEGAMQVPEMVAEIETGRAFLNIPAKARAAATRSMALLGAIRGTENGQFKEESVKQAAIGAAAGEAFHAIGNISASPSSAVATKILATAARMTAGAGVSAAGGGVSAKQMASLYTQDPDKFDQLIADMALGAFMTAIPNANPKKLAAKLEKFQNAREKVTNELLGNVRSEIDRSNDLQFSESKGQPRPATVMFDKIVGSLKKPIRSYRDLIGTIESHIQGYQAKKARIINESVSNIQSDPTLSLQSLRDSELTSPGSANPSAVRMFDKMIATEKALVGTNMSVKDAFKRQAELKASLNDRARLAENKVPLSKAEKMATQALINDYTRVIGEVENNFRSLSKDEATAITIKDLVSKKSASYQTNPAGASTEVAQNFQYRSAGAVPTIIGSLVSEGKNIFKKAHPVERATKEIIRLQKKIDTLSRLSAAKVVAEQNLQKFGDKQLVNVYNPNFVMKDAPKFAGKEAKTPPDIGIYEPIQPEPQRLITDSSRFNQVRIEGPSQQGALPAPERGFTMREPKPAPSQTLIEQIRAAKEAKANEGLPVIQLNDELLGAKIKSKASEAGRTTNPKAQKEVVGKRGDGSTQEKETKPPSKIARAAAILKNNRGSLITTGKVWRDGSVRSSNLSYKDVVPHIEGYSAKGDIHYTAPDPSRPTELINKFNPGEKVTKFVYNSETGAIHGVPIGSLHNEVIQNLESTKKFGKPYDTYIRAINLPNNVVHFRVSGADQKVLNDANWGEGAVGRNAWQAIREYQIKIAEKLYGTDPKGKTIILAGGGDWNLHGNQLKFFDNAAQAPKNAVKLASPEFVYKIEPPTTKELNAIKGISRITAGGATIDIRSGDIRTEGLFYSVDPALEYQVNFRDFSAMDIRNYVNANESQLKGKYLGVWEHNGKIYLDTVKNPIYNIDNLNTAIKEAQQGEQLQIYHGSKGKDGRYITIGTKKDGVYKPLPMDKVEGLNSAEKNSLYSKTKR